MNEQRELVVIVHDAMFRGDHREDPMTYPREVFVAADAILAAGYAKPRTITTVEELDALPIGSVIRTSGVEDECDPRVAVKAAFWHNESEWFTADDSEWCLSSDELDDLPATVLYEATA
jgi:hypothetical protein